MAIILILIFIILTFAGALFTAIEVEDKLGFGGAVGVVFTYVGLSLFMFIGTAEHSKNVVVEGISSGELEIVQQYTIVKGDTIDIEYTLVRVGNDE